jgi:hypothetical protein
VRLEPNYITAMPFATRAVSIRWRYRHNIRTR